MVEQRPPNPLVEVRFFVGPQKYKNSIFEYCFYIFADPQHVTCVTCVENRIGRVSRRVSNVTSRSLLFYVLIKRDEVTELLRGPAKIRRVFMTIFLLGVV